MPVWCQCVKNTIELSCQMAMFGEKTEYLLYWLIMDRAQRLRQPMLDERKKRFAIPEGLMAGSGGRGRSIDRDWRALVGLEAACGFVVLRL